jgi:hypothetical protein
MKILISGNYLDFEAPIRMEEDQFKKFIEFLKYLIREEIEVENVKEKERFKYHVEGGEIKNWKSEEFVFLLNPNIGDDELAEKLDRSTLSVSMQKAQFVPNFISWAKSKGYDASKISKTIIEQFLEEKEK